MKIIKRKSAHTYGKAVKRLFPLSLLSVSMSVISQSALATSLPIDDTQHKIDHLEQQYTQVSAEFIDRNKVLYAMEQGKLAFDLGDYSTAASFFDQAIAGIETVYSNHPGAQDARKLFHEEKEKPFKGETYERAMVFYYRGLLDLINHDYENARASFESGLLQDSMGVSRDYIQDFASLEYLSGWAARCAGFKDLSQQSFKRASKLNPKLVKPKANKKTLILGESGIIPFKYHNVDYGGELQYWQHPIDNINLGLMKYGRTRQPISDEIYYQAKTRGARIADQIAYSKANTKEMGYELANIGEAISGIAFGLMDIANLIVPMSGYIVMGTVGIASQATSVTLSEFSNFINAGVDVRQWKTIPNRLFITSSSNNASKVTRYVSFVDEYNQPLASKATILTGTGKCQLVRATHGALNLDQFQYWESVQLKLSSRNYPIYKIPKFWIEGSGDE